MNNNKNSKLIIYYKKENKEKLSQTKKILTFLNENNNFKEIHEEIKEFIYYYSLRQKYKENFEKFLKIEKFENFINTEGKLNQLFDEKLIEFKKYLNKEGEIKLDDGIEEFDGIKFIKLPDISGNQEYIIFFLLKNLSEKYENIPIIYAGNFYYINQFKHYLEKENDLIFQNAQSPNIFFKNIKKIDEILNFINENTNIKINDILNQFYEEEKKGDLFINYYNYKN
jgi:hypothetical protein